MAAQFACGNIDENSGSQPVVRSRLTERCKRYASSAPLAEQSRPPRRSRPLRAALRPRSSAHLGRAQVEVSAWLLVRRAGGASGTFIAVSRGATRAS